MLVKTMYFACHSWNGKTKKTSSLYRHLFRPIRLCPVCHTLIAESNSKTPALSHVPLFSLSDCVGACRRSSVNGEDATVTPERVSVSRSSARPESHYEGTMQSNAPRSVDLTRCCQRRHHTVRNCDQDTKILALDIEVFAISSIELRIPL